MIRYRIPHRPSRWSGADGFTLIETLVAFAVLALFVVVLQRGIIGAVDGAGRAQARLEAGMVAQTLIASTTLGSTGIATTGRLNGHDWAVRFETLDIPAGASGEAASSVFQPMRMIVEVATGNRRARPVTLETVRLVRTAGGASG